MTDRSLRPAHPTERAVGIEHYVSDVDGIGGRLRASPETFRVREIERIDPEPADADPGAYPHVVFRVTLRGWDTNDFARVLSNRLGISRERVRWAGTKDKRAVTTQLFSVDGIDPAELPAGDEESGAEPIGDAEVEVLGRLGRAVELGDLLGNEFEITVEDPERPELVHEITDALAAFAGDGAASTTDSGADERNESVAVPNVFGQQRFGSQRPITHEVGLAVVRGDWRDAVRTYVAECYQSERESTREARSAAGDCFDDGDWTGALAALPDRLGYERSLLHALEEQASADGGVAGEDPTDHGPDYRTALDALPWNLQRLFVHAAQSYAFNRICSARLEAGLPFARPVEGDVVCFADSTASGDPSLPDPDRTQRVTADRVDTVARHCERGRAFVTAPLVGTETDLGEGEPGEIERSVLDDLDLDPGDFDLPEPFDSTGTRRAILVRTDLTVRWERDATDDASNPPTPTFAFALPKGSYATVLLREYLKADPVDLG